ncbi:MAG: YbbR-like domain-containing protein [Flaviramulus sp.]|nr:YbbR-like domain-containing protein [Flaviramulus sp.]
MKKLKSKILSSIKNKRINVFLLFLISAFVILLFTKLSKEYTNTLTFEVEKLNVPQENIILNDSLKLYITLKTHGFKWLNYYLSKPVVKIDFDKDVYKREGAFVWNKSKAFLNNTQFDKQVEILNISPDTLTFRFGVNAIKKVPVTINANLNFSPGYNNSSEIVSDPDSIVIVGPKSEVSKIDFLATEEITLNDIRLNLEEIAKLKLPKNQSNLNFSNNDVILKAEVEKFTEGTLKIPITIINAPKERTIKYFPKKVTVSYYVSLSDYKIITAKDFEVICDFDKINNNQTILIPEFAKIPERVKNAKISQKRIEFIITK